MDRFKTEVLATDANVEALADMNGVWIDRVRDRRPSHGRITSETVGVVHVVIAANTPKCRLTELTHHAVPSVLAGTAVLGNILGNLGQAKGIVKLPIGEQPGVRGDLGTVKFRLQAAVKIDPKFVPL